MMIEIYDDDDDDDERGLKIVNANTRH